MARAKPFTGSIHMSSMIWVRSIGDTFSGLDKASGPRRVGETIHGACDLKMAQCMGNH